MAQSKLAEKLKGKGVRQPQVCIDEAKAADIRVATLLAMLEMETGIPQRNIFGCDHGPGKAFCHQEVTKARVEALLKSGLSNGVGWTQLTYRPFVEQAQRAGGAHIPRYQVRVGAKILRELFERYRSIPTMYARYNGSGAAAEAYGRKAAGLREKWLKVTDGR